MQVGIHILPFERGNPSESRTSTLCPQSQLRLAPSLLQMKVMSVAATAISWDACGRLRLNIDGSKIDIFSFAILGLVWEVLLFLVSWHNKRQISSEYCFVLVTVFGKKAGSKTEKGQIYGENFRWSLSTSFLACQLGANHCITLILSEFIQRETHRHNLKWTPKNASAVS